MTIYVCDCMKENLFFIISMRAKSKYFRMNRRTRGFVFNLFFFTTDSESKMVGSCVPIGLKSGDCFDKVLVCFNSRICLRIFCSNKFSETNFRRCTCSFSLSLFFLLFFSFAKSVFCLCVSVSARVNVQHFGVFFVCFSFIALLAPKIVYDSSCAIKFNCLLIFLPERFCESECVRVGGCFSLYHSFPLSNL